MHLHFNGSLGLDSTEEVFTIVGKLLGPHLRRMPDGEPGGRQVWVSWQGPVFKANRGLVMDLPPGAPRSFSGPVKLAEGVTPANLRFGILGYAREAQLAYQDLLAARARGDMPPNVRLQVSLPTPHAVVTWASVPAAIGDILPAYEAAMLREVERICAVIPHQDLAIQWDVSPEMLQLDGRMGPLSGRQPQPGMEDAFRASFARLASAVPAEVELGFHLCYGDPNGKHIIEPEDAAKLVEMANLISGAVQRSITFLQMPVPIERDDDAYFQPLAGLKLHPETELILGLVHAADGAEGTKRRLATARKHARDFGISTECGIGRRDRAVVLDFLTTYAAVAKDDTVAVAN